MEIYLKNILNIIIFTAIILIPVKITNYLINIKKVKLNRWIIGTSSFTFYTLFKVFLDEVPSFIDNIVKVIFISFIVMFFEISRMNFMETNYKGKIDYTKYLNK